MVNHGGWPHDTQGDEMSNQSTIQGTRGRFRSVRHLAALISLALVMALLSPLAVQAETPKGELKMLAALEDVDIPPFINVIGQQGKWTEFEGPFGRVYGNGSQGFALIVGASIADVCSGEMPPLGAGRFRQHYDGSWELRTPKGGIERDAYIYKTDLDVFAFFDASCGGFFEDGTPLPAAFASGPLTLRAREWGIALPFSEEQLPGRYKNSVRGALTGADGKEYRVRAVADYQVTGEGELDFFRDILKVRKLGK